ncbi:hypothetical protein [Candidatus Marimicrobium litorale]|uniref:EexN family lipoprotein n=1 Tax=Candidatus Marimicrobium litorale TaxID=2518991 RepID=A0ABT3T2T9_9GAMM|nr:hypothetical protein [Candidatus Marimicrobium litorale]MCX2976156.1 hypothetical protein [Candidatus Marimicrobium litorale]
MLFKQYICIFTIALVAAGCGSAERQANKSQVRVNDERLSLIDEYQKCVKKAGDNQEEADTCETLRKSAEALQ